MTLEDFERELAAGKPKESHKKRDRSRSRDREHRRSKDGERKHHHRHHHSSRNHSRRDNDENESRHHHKRSRHRDDESQEHRSKRKRDEQRDRSQSPPAASANDDEDEWVEKDPAPFADATLDSRIAEASDSNLQRDSWMQAPSALDVDYVQRKKKEEAPEKTKATQNDYQLKIHKNELNHHLRDLQNDLDDDKEEKETIADTETQHEVNYTFGDSGSSWRMTKLKNIYRQAEESGRPVEEVAVERYGNLRDFDDAREEEIEMDRRKTYGRDYVGKEKPSGELFQERKLTMGIRRESRSGRQEEREASPRREVMETKKSAVILDQTALNKLKAQMMKARLKGAPNAAELEAEYNAATAAAAANPSGPEVVVLGAMDSRMLVGSRKGEVKAIDNKRGRERGLVEENDDMSIEDMVKQERRTKGQGEGKAFAERIAKDVKFTNDLDYMDENAAKLAKRVQKSEINLRNTTIAEFQKMNRILDSCPLCYHEDTEKPPIAPVVSLATRVYLTLPTEPEVSPGGAVIVPIQHRTNLIECDDDEWEEIRNFMKSLIRYYDSQSLSVIFYENAANPHRRPHAALVAVPLPQSHGDTALAYFREAILASDEEWSQHKKLIDTGKKAREGAGRAAFRRSMPAELPYFHVWFDLDGGLGHVVEDSNRWPKGDLFAREVVGGMLDIGPEVIKRQGRWTRGADGKRVDTFRKGWNKWDWTSVLQDAA